MQDAINITDREFDLFRRLIHDATGISLSEHKRPLVCARLARRLRRLSLSSFTEYYEYLRLEDVDGQERRELINSITTNKTEFFREAHHFECLRQRVLEPLVASGATGGPRRLRIWSAGCSTGEEPYSIAMTVADVLRPLAAWDIRILASDIDTDVLARAQAARYPRALADAIPSEQRRQWCRAVGDEIEIEPELRRLVAFRQINFVEPSWPIHTHFDVIFCRNVMIYFDRDTQLRIYQRFHELSLPNALLVAGHSENLGFMSQLYEPLGNTVYRRRATGRTQGSRRALGAPATGAASRAGMPAPAAGSSLRIPIVVPPRVVLRPARMSLEPEAGIELSMPPRPTSSEASVTHHGQRWSRRADDAESASSSFRARQSTGLATRAPSLRARPSAALMATAPPPSAAPARSVRARPGTSVSAHEAVAASSSGPSPGPARVRIQSGELFASARPTVVTTLLGSCVAACVFDLQRGVGGMNHFMLPAGRPGDDGWNAVCYGTHAMELLINELLHLGARREHLRAHAFGAAHVLGAGVQANVAHDNANFIKAFLAREHIALESSHLGGERPLLVSFELHTGRVEVRAVGEAAAQVVQSEAKLRELNGQQPRALDDGVTLF